MNHFTGRSGPALEVRSRKVQTSMMYRQTAGDEKHTRAGDFILIYTLKAP